MAKRPLGLPANDNPVEPAIRLDLLEFPPICAAEVEIFDGLISNITNLAANDNEAPPQEPEK